MLGFSFIVAALLSLIVEHSARSVAAFLARAAGRLYSDTRMTPPRKPCVPALVSFVGPIARSSFV
eukprot:5598071-Prymnesium_polylepis.1